MTRQQAKRMAQALEGSFLLSGGDTACITDNLSPSDVKRFDAARIRLGWELLNEAGFTYVPTPEDILSTILPKKSVSNNIPMPTTV